MTNNHTKCICKRQTHTLTNRNEGILKLANQNERFAGRLSRQGSERNI